LLILLELFCVFILGGCVHSCFLIIFLIFFLFTHETAKAEHVNTQAIFNILIYNKR